MGQAHGITASRRGKHFSYRERVEIEIRTEAKQKSKEISQAIGCSERSVQRERKRGQVTQQDYHYRFSERYSADFSERRYRLQGRNKGPGLKIGKDHRLCRHIEERILERKYSPDAVVGEIKAQGLQFETSLCTRTVYSYIEKHVFLNIERRDLPEGGRRRKRKYHVVRPAYNNRRGRSIEERSPEVEERTTQGDWEMDCVVGGAGLSSAALLVLTERVSRIERIYKLPRKTQEEVAQVLNREERRLGRKRFSSVYRTITVDNGCEFLNFASLEKSVRKTGKPRTRIYYAHPFSSWERGSNENQNKMIRRFIPKGTDIGLLSDEEIQRIAHWMNRYPRRILNYRTAEQTCHLTL